MLISFEYVITHLLTNFPQAESCLDLNKFLPTHILSQLVFSRNTETTDVQIIRFEKTNPYIVLKLLQAFFDIIVVAILGMQYILKKSNFFKKIYIYILF